MRHGRRAAVLAAVVFATPMFTASPMRAQGIAVNAHSGCNSGRFEAVIADPCADGSSVWYSPAALAFEPSVVTVGGTIVRNSSTFTPNADPTTVYKRGPANPLAPHAWFNYRVNDRMAFGIGGWAPYGLTLKWDPNTFPGRFGGYDNTVKAFYVQPTVAYQLVPKKLAVAAGVDAVFGIMNITMREDVATQVIPDPRLPAGTTFNAFGIPFGTDFASLQLKANKVGFTAHFGALWKPSDRFSIGARYLMGAKVNFDNGTANFEKVATNRTLAAGNPFGAPAGTPLDALFAPKFLADSLLADQKVSAEITYPAMAVVGIAVKVIPTVELSGDYQWTQWSKWDSVTLHFANPKSSPTTQKLYLLNQNTTTIRTGVNWVATKALQLRGGWGWNNAAETDFAVSPLLPEAKRNYYSLGAGYELSKSIRFDAFWQNVQQAARQGRLYPISEAQAKLINAGTLKASDVNVGLYTNTANLFGASLSYTFGKNR